MNLVRAILLGLALVHSAFGAIIDHDKVQPFAQPEPVTVAEKAAVKYKPQLLIGGGCVSFPAVNAAGEITGGLKGTKGTEGCTEAPLGSQIYGRSTWYQDKWAMMFAWYFPKNLWMGGAKSRHLWSNMVLWLDNPSLESPKLLGVSLSRQTLQVPKVMFVRFGEQEKDPYSKDWSFPLYVQLHRSPVTGGSNRSTRVYHGFPDNSVWLGLDFSYGDGEYQDLIMWEQLTDQARTALESADFGEDTKVPFTDKNFEGSLSEAFPF